MTKKKPETADREAAERFERALRKALNTPPDAPRKKAKARRKKKA
jgi:hypothetical protein